MNTPNLGNLGKQHQDFMGPRPTKMEVMATELLQNCEMKNMNLARQVRTICILLGIKVEDFVAMFDNDQKQNEYVMETIAQQKKYTEEKKEKQEEEKAKEIASQFKPDVQTETSKQSEEKVEDIQKA